MSIIDAGWSLMGYGIVGVFASLVLFYVFVKALLAISKKQQGKNKD